MDVVARRPVRATVVGVLLVLWGAGLGLLLFLQPWASCPDDDAAAGCPVPAEAVPHMTAALTSALVAVVLGVVLLAGRRRTRG